MQGWMEKGVRLQQVAGEESWRSVSRGSHVEQIDQLGHLLGSHLQPEPAARSQAGI